MTPQESFWLDYVRFIGTKAATTLLHEIPDFSYCLDTIYRSIEKFPDDQLDKRLISTIAFWFGCPEADEKIAQWVVLEVRQKIDELLDKWSLYDIRFHGERRAEELRADFEAFEAGQGQEEAEIANIPEELRDLVDGLRDAAAKVLSGSSPGELVSAGNCHEDTHRRNVLSALTDAILESAKTNGGMANIPEKLDIKWRDGNRSQVRMIGLPQ